MKSTVDLKVRLDHEALQTIEACTLKADWTVLPHGLILYIFDYIQANLRKQRPIIARFRNDPLNQYRLMYRSLRLHSHFSGEPLVPRITSEIILEQVRNLELYIDVPWYYAGRKFQISLTGAEMPQLQTVDIEISRLRGYDMPEIVFCFAKHIRSLTIFDNGDLSVISTRLPRLKHLIIDRIESIEHVSSISALEHLSTLHVSRISENMLSALFDLCQHLHSITFDMKSKCGTLGSCNINRAVLEEVCKKLTSSSCLPHVHA